jgi:integrase
MERPCQVLYTARNVSPRYITGIRKGELLAVTWPQVDFEGRLITLDYGETKNQEARSVPIIAGDMFNALTTAKRIR